MYRCIPWIVLPTLLLVAAGWRAGALGGAAPPPRKPPVIEEEEEPRPKKPPATKPRVPVIEEEEDPKVKKPRPVLPTGPVNLADEARKAEHPELRKVLEELAVPHDTVVSKMGTVYRVVPLARPFDPSGFSGVSFQVLTADGQPGPKYTLPRDSLSTVTHYERRALAEARRLLASGLDRPDGAGQPAVPRLRLLRVAEMVLSEALRFHTAAPERQAAEWRALEKELRAELLRVQIAQLRTLTAERNWELAEALAVHLHGQHSGSAELLAAVEDLYLAQAHEAIRKDDYPRAREHVESLQRNFPVEVTPQLDKVQELLRQRARELFDQVKALADAGQTSEALPLLEQAERIWPRLPGLRDLRLRMQKLYPVLRVGVRSLPVQMAPTHAETDVDRMAVRLLFDRLLELRAAPSAREGYISKLGAEPRHTPAGWELVLPRDLTWSDGRPVTAEDIHRSVQLLGDPRSPTYDPLAAELLRVRIDDPYRVTLTLERGHVDPLALLTFELLPAHHFPREPEPPYLSNPRVCFLAPNYRRPAMQNEDLRRAIAFAIDRERILREVFRGRDQKHHQALYGPFPLGSWAYHPEYDPAKNSPYNPAKAREALQRVKAAPGPLVLRYASDVPGTRPACEQIRDMLQAIGLTVTLNPLPTRQLVADLAKDRPDFDLLYWHYDFDNETLSLWPLFAPAPAAAPGRNVLAYPDDGQLQGLFRELQHRRDFSAVQRQAHELHELMMNRMVLIPLWQLDRHYAVHRSLRYARLHPLWFFADVEEWRLESGG